MCALSLAIPAQQRQPQATPPSQAQRRDEPGTKFEKLLLRKGIVVIKEFYDIGSLKSAYGPNLKIVAAALSTPGDQIKLYALRFEITSSREYSSEQTGIIDFDELVSLQSALDQMIRMGSEMKISILPPALPRGSSLDTPFPEVGSTTPGRHIEVVFVTRGSVRAGFFESKSTLVGFVAANDYSSDGSVYLSFQQLDDLKALLEKARQKLAELGAK
jgi:hypothetical protein